MFSTILSYRLTHYLKVSVLERSWPLHVTTDKKSAGCAAFDQTHQLWILKSLCREGLLLQTEKMICMSCATALVAASCIACGPLVINNCLARMPICVTLATLITVATVIACAPFWMRHIFNIHCHCPSTPICPDCGKPF
ncbi:unnamed protein product [Arctia plantaginis]|uniref:Uncharacterized protein n=1 Tax=Arctia plantaginis TaxID=874455 RepID=A0A8S0ZYM2_ARCPL|nr:unnamed protein product [Arctia plantaginis]CAB3238153.1 unnamed protein product [Arctia plantaginis]